MEIRYPTIGICGLSCRLCPNHNTTAKSRCHGCKSPGRMAAGCPFITCAIKRKGVEFCWDCPESGDCEKWATHRKTGKRKDSFTCYQGLERDIEGAGAHGVAWLDAEQAVRGELLEEMLRGFNDGRSKRTYCIAATVLDPDDLRECLVRATRGSGGLEPGLRARMLRDQLEEVARRKGLVLALRK